MKKVDIDSEFGGYDKAKKSYFKWFFKYGFKFKKVKDLCLHEYRLAHKFYEVGDEVVRSKHYPLTDNSTYLIKYINSEKTIVEISNGEFGYYLHVDSISHFDLVNNSEVLIK